MTLKMNYARAKSNRWGKRAQKIMKRRKWHTEKRISENIEHVTK